MAVDGYYSKRKTISDIPRKGEINLEDINENAISSHLCLHNQPGVDLVIRTGGEHRIIIFLFGRLLMLSFILQVLA